MRVWMRQCVPAVHPRVCGELLIHSIRALANYGSSPRVWGTLLISLNPLRLTYTVHPRVCGELQIGVAVFTVILGSSPRVWGTRGRRHGYLCGRRFIPACVGNSVGNGAFGLYQPVHPRVCGELIPGFVVARS